MAGIEPATLAVLRPRDNHYTTLTTLATCQSNFTLYFKNHHEEAHQLVHPPHRTRDDNSILKVPNNSELFKNT